MYVLSLTALTTACLNGKKSLVQLLLSREAMLTKANTKGFTPLLCAVKSGYWDIAVILLRQGADIESKDTHGRSALMIAAAEGHVGLVEMLLTNSKSTELLLDISALLKDIDKHHCCEIDCVMRLSKLFFCFFGIFVDALITES